MGSFDAVEPSAYVHSSSLSADGQFLFTTVVPSAANSPHKVYISRITGCNPSVIQILSLPSACTSNYVADPASIAAGAPDQNGDYDVYIGRRCFSRAGCPKNQDRSKIEVRKFRYSPSSMAWTESAGNVFELVWNQGRCGDGDFATFVQNLRILNGTLNAVFAAYQRQVFQRLTLQLSQVDSSLNTSSVSLKIASDDFGACGVEQIELTSTASFYGVCLPPATGKFLSDSVQLISLLANTVTRVPPPQGSKWLSLGASEPSSRCIYIVGGESNTTFVYSVYQGQSDQSPQQLFPLDPALLKGARAGFGGIIIRRMFVLPTANTTQGKSACRK